MTSLPSNKRRLVLTIYRNLVRWCNDIPPSIPLDKFIPPMRDTSMDDVGVFKRVLREEFRDPVSTENDLKERIQKGLNGIRQLNEIHPDVIAYTRQWGERIRAAAKNSKQPPQSPINKTLDNALKEEEEWVKGRVDSIRWLNKLEDSTPPQSPDDIEEDSKFPLFPLQSTIFHPDTNLFEDESNNNTQPPLPLFTPQSEIPVPGYEIPLKIFEPRYRQLYNDLLMKPVRKRNFVVPFAHPTIPGRYAEYGLLYQVTQLREVADETNGTIQYLANHVVTKPIQLMKVLNPQVWETQETYLQIQGRVREDRFDTDNTLYEPLKEFLLEWTKETSHPLAQKSLSALEKEGFWALVHVWNCHFQQELLQLQLGIATQVKRNANNLGDTAHVTPDIVAHAQQPHRKRLLQLMLDTSLLVPTLLSLDGVGKCEHMINVIDVERDH